MMTKKYNPVYSYPAESRLVNNVFTILTVYEVSEQAVHLYRTTNSFFLDPSATYGNILFHTLLFIIALAALSMWMNFEPTFALYDKGLRVKVFIFWGITIPWEAILDTKEFKWFGYKASVVVVRDLTFFHRLFGLIFGRTIYPAFLIAARIPRYSEALNIIRRMMDAPIDEIVDIPSPR
jgi:hypothetical protein